MKIKSTLIATASAIAISLTAYSCMISIGTGTTVTTTTTISALSQHLISATQAKVLSDEYNQKNYKMVNVGKSLPETTEVYYDIEVLEDYLKYVKAEAKKNKIKNVGIAIAFGQYPNNKSFDSRLKQEYQGKQTVYLKAVPAPTAGVGKVGIGGYSPEDNLAPFDKISAFDFGQLTPPER